eukprot:PhM_4_TR16993/c0_g1_i1/m.97409/K17914/KIF13; kinesin family member 13
MSITVAVRVRPFHDHEDSASLCVSMSANTTKVSAPTEGEHTFLTDHALWSLPRPDGAWVDQVDVYQTIGRETVENAYNGYNGCLFAYGQTSSGKTYSMMGPQDNPGLIPRICEDIFSRVDAGTKVEVAYYEIYCEKVRCLLNPSTWEHKHSDRATGLRVREHPVTGPYVDGLAQVVVTSANDVLKLMLEGNRFRSTASTEMNSVSSRSHAVFMLRLTQTFRNVVGDVEVTSTKEAVLNLVDLAGSERVAKTHATGTRFLEGANINKSLSTLGTVISHLSDARHYSHIPYRDSVLTWLLKEALGGNSKTVMLATISPAPENFEETISTLRYAERAKKIMNHAVVNEDSTQRRLLDMQSEIDRLRDELSRQRNEEARASLQHDLIHSESLLVDMQRTWAEKEKETQRIMEERESSLAELSRKLREKADYVDTLEEEVLVYKTALHSSESRLQASLARVRELEAIVRLGNILRDEEINESNMSDEQPTENFHLRPDTDLSPNVMSMVERLGKSILTDEEHILMRYANVRIIARVVDALEQGDLPREVIWSQLLSTLRARRGIMGPQEVAKEEEEDDEDDLEVDESDDDDDDGIYLQDSEAEDGEAAEDEEEDIILDDDDEAEAHVGDEGDDDIILDDDDEELVVDDDEEGHDGDHPKGDLPPDTAKEGPKELELPPGHWACGACTFINDKPYAPVCAVCNLPRVGNEVIEDEVAQTAPESEDVRRTINDVPNADPQIPAATEGQQRPRAVNRQSRASVISRVSPVVQHEESDHADFTVKASDIHNHRMMQFGFKVSKWNLEAGFLKKALKKDRIWEIDFFNKRFINKDKSGKTSFEYAAQHLYRIERHVTNPRMLRLLFFRGPHPYDLLFSSTEMCTRFLELALTLRRGGFMWSPNLCPDAFKDVSVTVARPPTARVLPKLQGETSAPGAPVISATKMPYEVVRVWTGIMSLNNRGLPSQSALDNFLPKAGFELYAIGVKDIPVSQRGKPHLTEMFQQHLGNVYFQVIATQSEPTPAQPHLGNMCIILFVKRRHLLRLANIEAVEVADYPKQGAMADKSACAISIRYNDSTLAFALIDIAPSFEGSAASEQVVDLFGRINLGNPALDFSTRFDNIFVLGRMNYKSPFTEDDGLLQESSSGAAFFDFREAQPDEDMAHVPVPERVVCWYRQRTCKIQPLQYATVASQQLGNNVYCTFDVYTLRNYLGVFVPPLPNLIRLQKLSIQGKQIPEPIRAELVIHGEWIEGCPYTIPLQLEDGRLVSVDDCIPPLRPVNTGFEFLRVQHILFTLQGVLQDEKSKGKQIIASGSIPLKNVLCIGRDMPFMSVVLKCSKAMGVITGELGWFAERGGDIFTPAKGSALKHSCVAVVSCLENEALVDGTWKPSKAPPNFTALNGLTESTPTSLTPPDNDWVWVSDWQIRKNDDDDGWVHADSFTATNWAAVADDGHCVRRRTWFRAMRCRDEEKYKKFIEQPGVPNGEELL